MTSQFFHHFIAIDMYQISQAKKISEKPGITPNCGFFQLFLALLDTFTTRYSDIKFDVSDQFQYKKHFT